MHTGYKGQGQKQTNKQKIKNARVFLEDLTFVDKIRHKCCISRVVWGQRRGRRQIISRDCHLGSGGGRSRGQEAGRVVGTFAMEPLVSDPSVRVRELD